MNKKSKRANKRALLVWELGAGLGHTKRLLSICQALTENGWTLIFAVRNIYTLNQEMKSVASQVIQAPVNHNGLRSGQSFSAASFADILAISGCGNVDTLMAMVTAWEGLIENVEPDVIIADYSPYLSIAARNLAPLIQIGSSFALPPNHLKEFPQLRDSKGAGISQERLLENVAEVQKRRGQPVPDSLPELISGDKQIICVMPMFDSYEEHRLIPATGPIDSVHEALPPPHRKHLFIYLAADFKPTFPVLQAVVNSKVSANAFIRDASESLRKKCKKLGIDVSAVPLPMNKALNDCSVILHHGGISTTERAAAAGRPQLLLPRHLEQALTASKAKSRNLADTLQKGMKMEEMVASIKNFMSDDKFQLAAQNAAREITALKPFQSLNLILETADKLAAQKR
jgi:rhamnosyltransferase subunit B